MNVRLSAGQISWCDVLARVYWDGGDVYWETANNPQGEYRSGAVDDDDAVYEMTRAMEECVWVRE